VIDNNNILNLITGLKTLSFNSHCSE